MSTSLSDKARRLLQGRLQQRQLPGAADHLPVVVPDMAARYQPFPLLDMQQAYWIGRQGDDQTGMHYFMERSGQGLDLPTLQRAWETLLQRHDMLRVVIRDDQQQVLPIQTGVGLPQCEDWSGQTEAAWQPALAQLRERLMHRKADLAQWPQHEVWLCLLPEGRFHLLMSLDIWCIDGQSIQTLLGELALACLSPAALPPVPGLAFRDYALACKAFERSAKYQADLAWWQARLPTLPAAPALPLVTQGEGGRIPARFARCETRLSEAETRQLRQLVSEQGLTLAALLATCYSEVLARWSGCWHFVLNMPRFNRMPVHPDIHRVLGEFASFNLLEVRLHAEHSLGERVRALQQQLWQDMEHDAVSGVRVLREWNQLSGGSQPAPAPIVFTSLPELAMGADNIGREVAILGDVVQSLSQTPQVWLDCQYYQEAGQLRLNWDYLAERFPQGMVDAMFDGFVALVRQLAAGGDTAAALLNASPALALPEAQRARRVALNQTDQAFPWRPLAQRMVTNCQAKAARMAVITESRVWTFAELQTRALALADHLQHEDGRVALVLSKGGEQLVAVMACVLAGRSYLPLDVEQPLARLNHILDRAGVSLVLCDEAHADTAWPVPSLNTVDWPLAGEVVPAALPGWQASPDAETYVLFTSGSTGEPKGVPVLQRGVCNVLDDQQSWLGLGPADRIFAISALHHDMSVPDVYGCLTLGASLLMPSQAARRHPAVWLQMMQQYPVQYWNSVPALLQMLLTQAEAEGVRLAGLTRVTLGGDWVAAELVQQLWQHLPELTVYSVGGPTEITVWNIHHRITAQDVASGRIPYGRPMANARYHVLNERDEACPDWVVGELVCAGIGLSPGYLDPALPGFAPIRGLEDHAYRTGDLGRVLPSGEIEFIGRRDQQFKLNGYRIEPGEIEAVLQRHPQVERAVVVKPEGQAFLLAWIEGTVALYTLRDFAANWLPAPMVPQRWQYCEEWPLTGNGKLDRRALAAPALLQTERTSEALQGEMEHWLAAQWADLLRRPVLDRQTNFFHAGGDSLLAVQLAARIRQRWQVVLPLQRLFAAAVLHDLAHWLAGEQANVEPASNTLEHFPPRQALAAPLSWSQRGLWFIEQQQPGTTRYALPLVLQLDGPLQREVWREAVDAVLAQHELFRCRYLLQGEGPVMLPDGPSPRLQLITQPEGEAVEAELSLLLSQGFDLAAGESLRVSLLQVHAEQHLLVLHAHHIAFDGWSFGEALQQFSAAYHQLLKGEPVAPQTYHYGDYASWQQSLPLDAVARTFWQQALTELPVLALTTDRPRPAHLQGAAGCVSLRLPDELVQQLDQLARRTDCTRFMLLLSVFQLLLGRYAQQEAVVVGSYVAGREHPASQHLLGCCVNNLPLCARWQPTQRFVDYLQQNRQHILQAFEHQHFPFEQMVALQGQAPDPARHPLYQVGFAMQPAAAWSPLQGGVSLQQLRPPVASAHMDIDLYVLSDETGLQLELNYLSELFDAARMQNLLQHYQQLLASVCAQPEAELLQLAYWPAPIYPVQPADPAIDLPQRLLDSLLQHADQVLLQAEGQDWTGRQLLEISQAWARQLQAEGVEPGQRVGVYLQRSVQHVCSMLALCWLGAVYVPLDADYPDARIHDMLDLAEPVRVLTVHALQGRLPAHWQALSLCLPLATTGATEPWLLPVVQTREVMYVLFTSGSTGRPKGVMGTWLTAQSRTDWSRTTYPIERGTGCAVRTPMNFVDALWEVLDPLLAGGRLVLVPSTLLMDSAALLPWLEQQAVRRMVIVPGLLRGWLQQPHHLEGWHSLQLLLSSGEAPQRAELQQLYQLLPEVRFVNLYGSSEVADVTVSEWPRGPSPAPVTLGKPLPGCQLLLLDRWLQAVPPGNSGQIHVAGWHLPAGYLAQPTPELCLPDTGWPLFPMGDWGHLEGTGDLRHEGRRDELVKIRGNRVELGEVLRQLQQVSGLSDISVQAVADPQGGLQLVAWLGGVEREALATLRQQLSARLPAYMVPTRWHALAQLPRLPNGKLDRTRLLTLEAESPPQSKTPVHDEERALATMLAEVIGLSSDQLDLTQGFYELGLNSLSLAVWHARLEARYPKAGLTLTELFQYNNLRQLAARLSPPSATDVRDEYESMPLRQRRERQKRMGQEET
ncbi:amino acid adenylation domain-containing protein [Leeia sp.]|uniref:amino acid adenylation domain-containing protein n=1 Tax=Leeia sp. TaxID=2884678 RepID=UPI0035B2286C